MKGAFCLHLYGIRHMVKDHLDSEGGNLLPPLHRLLFPNNSKGSFICTIMILHTMSFVSPLGEIAQ